MGSGAVPGAGSPGVPAGRGADAAWRAMTWASVALAALVAKGEAGAVIQEVMPTGQYSAGALYGPGQLFAPASPAATLNAWTQASGLFSDLWIWLSVLAGFDVVFIAGYVGLGLAFRSAPAWHGERPSSAVVRLARRWRLLAWWPLYALALVNLIQDVIAVTVFCVWIRQHRLVPVGLAWVLEAAVIAKWILAVVLAAWLIYRVFTSDASARRAGQITVALKKQRFSLVIVALLAVIAIGRGTDVLEQFPDVQRAWITWPPSLGWLHLAFAVAAQVLLALLLVLLSAMRVQRTRDTSTPGDLRDEPSYWVWLLIAAAVPALALVLWLTDTAAVSWHRVIAVPAVLGAVVVASLITHFAGRTRSAATDAQAGQGEGDGAAAETEDAVRTTGDLLAIAAVAVTGLGLVRSFTAAAMVVGRPYSWAFAVAVAVGFAVAALPWVVARGWVERYAQRFDRAYHSTGWNRGTAGLRRTGDKQHDGHGGTRSPALPLALFAIPFLVADVLLIFVPLASAHWLGVLATTVIALGTLAVGLAVLAYLVQSRKPLPVFTLLRLKATPVITLILIVALVGAVLDTASRLHEIRLPHAVAASVSGIPVKPDRAPTVGSRLQQWLADPETRSCAIPAPGSAGTVRVEPLVLVAAAGGGIRAAWWTVQALDRLAATPCGRHAVFAASGVSGGSLGLAIMAATAHRDAALTRIAGPDALAAAIDGLLLRDTVAGMTGLDLAAADVPAGQRFPDRAALLEHAWESEDPGLAQPFPLRRPALPWLLMFNSTAVGTRCRAVIAEARMAPVVTRAAAASPTCGLTTTTTSAVPDSYDFFAQLPCLAGLDTATAALLSARFPYVTPSGVVTGCGQAGTKQVEQYVDGGYADSTGLATLAGLASGLTSVIGQYNARTVARPQPGQPVTLVVPVTVYLGNSPQPEPITGVIAASPPQPLIPPLTSSAHGQLSSSDALLQQLYAATAHGQWLACPPAVNGAGPRPSVMNPRPPVVNSCPQDEKLAAGAVPQQLIVVVPRTFPSVATPLGWVLSGPSRTTLSSGATKEASSVCPDPRSSTMYCPAGVGRLGDLLRLIDHGPGAP